MSDASEHDWPDWLPEHDLDNLPEPSRVLGVNLVLKLLAADGVGDRTAMRVEYDAALLGRADVVRLLREHADFLEAR